MALNMQPTPPITKRNKKIPAKISLKNQIKTPMLIRNRPVKNRPDAIFFEATENIFGEKLKSIASILKKKDGPC